VTGRVAVSNASPLIALTQLDRLALLGDLFVRVLVPLVVLEEARTVRERPAWLVATRPPRPLPASVVSASLGPGETEAIALALSARPDLLLLDDGQARTLALRHRLPVTGTLGVLLPAKQHGLLRRIRPEVDRLYGFRFFNSERVRMQALRQAGEDV
jgi:uncharacterized protein